MRKTIWIFVLALALNLPSFLVAAQGRGKAVGKAKSTAQKAKSKDAKVHERHALGKDEEKYVRDWFGQRKNQKGLPPGLAKREQLPPGLERQLQKNGILPPGLQKRLQPLPEDLEVSLPELPAGLKRGFIGDDLLLIDENSQQILDIVPDVFWGTAGVQ